MNANPLPKACIIGAGCSGFTTAKRLKDEGVPYDCFEASDNIGGTWYFKNPNGLSACYQSLHIDTSKWRLAFEDFAVPSDWPDFPSHSQLLQYFHDYVDHFDLRRTITFNTRVESAEQGSDGLWNVRLSNGETRVYDVLFVCNGHHWDPRSPEYPGTFDGYAFHAHAYSDPFDPVDMRGKNIVVVGMGNSAMDIASELSQRPIAKNLWVAARRGVWVLPKYMDGKVADKAVLPAWMPRALGRALARAKIRKTVGNMEDYGLPKPDHEPLDAHPSVSGEFLTRAGCGDIKFKPNIKAFEGFKIRFEDDSVEEVDAVIYATGYKISFPFFSAEQQAKLAVAYLVGRYLPPSPEDMSQIIAKDEKIHLGHYYASARHTIQVDFNTYVRDLLKEIELGAKRAGKSGGRLPVPARAKIVKSAAE